MKLPRTTRGTSAPPISLTTASIRLTHATTTIRPRRQRQSTPSNNRLPTPQPEDRLGSPFAFHQARSRAGTPSTVASLTESLHGGGQHGRTCTYWLRSSRESEFDYRVNQLRTPGDLRVLIGHVLQLGDQILLARCHGILVEMVSRFIGDWSVRETLERIDIQMLIQQAEGCGFWAAERLPGVQQNGRMSTDCADDLGIGDRYTTPPPQTRYQHYQ